MENFPTLRGGGGAASASVLVLALAPAWPGLYKQPVPLAKMSLGPLANPADSGKDWSRSNEDIGEGTAFGLTQSSYCISLWLVYLV